MNCPGCGAIVHLVGSRGHFRCEHCGRFHFPEETNDGIAVLDTDSDLGCPVCTEPMRNALIEGESVTYCVQCRGFVTRTATFGRIVTRRRARNTVAVNNHEPFDPTELQRGVSCPGCNRRMETHAYGGGGNAVVDTCPRCDYIWLDADELTIIGRYLPHVPRRDPPTPLVREEDPEPSLLDWF